MHPNNEMKRVVQGKRYAVGSSTLLASDEVWDGSNFERHGRNIFLYKTRGGAFFVVNLTQWTGEQNTLIPLARQEAIDLYESLPEHNVDYENAFDVVVEDAVAGRPTYYGKPMRQTAIWMPEEMIEWLKNQNETMSDSIRKLIENAMSK